MTVAKSRNTLQYDALVAESIFQFTDGSELNGALTTASKNLLGSTLYPMIEGLDLDITSVESGIADDTARSGWFAFYNEAHDVTTEVNVVATNVARSYKLTLSKLPKFIEEVDIVLNTLNGRHPVQIDRYSSRTAPSALAMAKNPAISYPMLGFSMLYEGSGASIEVSSGLIAPHPQEDYTQDLAVSIIERTAANLEGSSLLSLAESTEVN